MATPVRMNPDLFSGSVLTSQPESTDVGTVQQDIVSKPDLYSAMSSVRPVGKLTTAGGVTPSAPSVADNLPETLSIAGLNTPIPLSKPVAATLVGIGDSLSYVYRGAKQALGIDVESMKDDERFLNALYSDEELGTYGVAGKITGAFVEPAGAVLALTMPAIKVASVGNALQKTQNAAKIIGTSAAAGAVYEGGGYKSEGETRLDKIANGAMWGAAGGTAVYAGVRGAKAGSEAYKKATANFKLDQLEKRAAVFRSTEKNSANAYAKAAVMMDLEDADVEHILSVTGRTKTPFGKISAKKYLDAKAKEKIDKSYAFEKKHPVLAKGKHLGGTLVGKIKTGFQGIDYRIRDISPSTWRALKTLEREKNRGIHKANSTVAPFTNALKDLKKSNPAVWQQYFKAYQNNDGAEQLRILSDQLGREKANEIWTSFRSTMDQLYDMEKVKRPGLEKIKDYAPTRVKDFERLNHLLDGEARSAIEKQILDMEKAKHGGKLTDHEKSRIYSKFLRNPSKPTKIDPKSTKTRTIKDKSFLEEHLQDVYDDPWDAIQRYIDETQTDIHTSRFFGKHIPLENGDDMSVAIVDLLEKEVASGQLRRSDVAEMKHLFDAYFVNSKRQAAFWNRTPMEVMYGTLLGNPLSALTQVGDLAPIMFINAHKGTVLDSVKGIVGRDLSASEMGIVNHVMHEIGTRGWSSKYADTMMRLGGFKLADMSAKSASLNSSLGKYSAWAKGGVKGRNEIIRQWGDVMSNDEITQLIADLNAKKGIESSLIREVTYADLTKTNPQTLLEMPQFWLEHPNARIFYMLKNFTIRYNNLIVENIKEDFRKGQFARGVGRMGIMIGMFTAVTGSIDAAKTVFLGDPADAERASDMYVTALAKNFPFFDRYQLGKLAESGEISSFFIDNLAPPLNVLDPITKALVELSHDGKITDKTWNDIKNRIPPYGKMLNFWFSDGKDFAEEKRADKEKTKTNEALKAEVNW